MPISYTRTSAIRQRDGVSATSDLPSALQNAVPYCAANCISSYLAQEFSCSSTDLSCLCKSYGIKGYTLGELAYGCLELNCLDTPSQVDVSLYSICNSEPGAVTATHSALTLPPLTTTRVVASSPPTSSNTIATASASSTAAAYAAGPVNAGLSTLTSGQAVGVSIGAMGALVLAGLLAFLILCLRKRRKHRQAAHGSYDFVDEGSSRQLSLRRKQESQPYFHPRLQQTQTSKRPFSWYSRREQHVRKSQTIRQVETQQKDESRGSDESTRTVSQLLPAKPWSTQPLPAPPASKRPTIAASPATVFDDHGSPQIPAIKKPLPAMLGGAIYHTARQSPSRQPPLSLDIPRVVGRSPKDKVKAQVMPPFDLQVPSGVPGHSAQPTAEVLRYYVTNDTSSPPDTPTPIDEEEQKRRAIPPTIRIPPPVCPQKAYRASAGSDTSFEDSDPDEPTPPEEKALTPAAEKGVTYPRIPRSSNQAVARTLPNNPAVARTLPSNQAVARTLPSNQGVASTMPSNQGVARTLPTWYNPPRVDSPQTRVVEQSTPSGTAKVRDQLEQTKTTLGSPIGGPQAHRMPGHNEQTKVPLGSLNGGGQARRMPDQNSPLRGYGRTGHTGLPSNPKDTSSKRPQHDRKMALRSPNTPTIKTQEVRTEHTQWEPKLTPSRRGNDLFLNVNMASPGVAPREIW